MLQLRTLGGIELTVGEGRDADALLSQPKRLALFCYLALPKPGTLHRRDTLLGLFWPEIDENHARMDLRQALSFIRRVLGAETLIRRGDTEIGINPEVVHCDAAAFDRAIANCQWAEAIEEYRGEFLEGTFLAAEPEYERWIDAQRARFARQYETALEQLCDSAVAAGDHKAAVEYCLRLTWHDPYNSGYASRLMDALDSAGDPGNALLQARRHVETLQRELNLEPPAEIEALIERLREAHAREEATQAKTPEEIPDRSHAEVMPPSPPGGNVTRAVARRRIWPAVVVVTAVVAVVGTLLITGDEGLVRDRVAVLPFENRTDDVSLGAIGRIAADQITRHLTETGLMQVVPTMTVLQAGIVAADSQNASDRGSDDFRWARLLRAGTLVHGSYTRHGDSLAFWIQACDVREETIMLPLDVPPVAVADPMPGIRVASNRVTGALASIFDPDFPMASITAAGNVRLPNYDAYRAFATGERLLAQGDVVESVRYLRAATERDSSFMQARLLAAVAHMWLQQYEMADSFAHSVAAARVQLPALDRHALDWLEGRLHGDYSRTLVAAREMANLAPGSGWHFAAAVEAVVLNRPDEAALVCLAMDPEHGFIRSWESYWLVLAQAYHLAGEHQKELEVARQAAERSPQEVASLLEVRALAALGRVEEVAGLFGGGFVFPSHHGFSGSDAMMYAAAELRAHGYPQEALDVVQRFLESLLHASTQEARSWNHRFDVARALYAAERWEEATRAFLELAEDYPEHIDVRGHVGVLAARAGDTAQARESLLWLRNLGTPFLFGANTYWRARIAAQLGELDRSIALLRTALAEGWRQPRNAPYWGIHMERDFEPLHDHPGFQELMRPQG
jgi:DNA-binding SARP family transcriptional activator